MAAGAVFGTAVVAIAVLVFVRLVMHTTPTTQAASVIYYPNFCLGGWKYPQYASGPPAATAGGEQAFTLDNSAYLESSVASQIFCGYFSVRNAKNPPTKAKITFNWAFKWRDGNDPAQHPEAYTSTSSSQSSISPATGFVVATSTGVVAVPLANPTSVQNTAAAADARIDQNNNPATSSPVVAPVTESSAAPSSPGTTEVPLVHDATNVGTDSSPQGGSNVNNQSTTPQDNPSAGTSTTADSPNTSAATGAAGPESGTVTTSPQPDPASSPSTPPPSSPDSTPTPAPESPQSFVPRRSSWTALLAPFIIERVHAAEPDQIASEVSSFHDFLEVSYSLDGIRWVPIGRVNKDNWRDYSIDIPVSSWEEVKRLQIMISVLPTIDEKPDIYLDGISMRAEYDRTVAELAADGLEAVSYAVDTLIGEGNGAANAFEVIPETPKGPQPIEVRVKKLLFPSVGRAIKIMHDVFDEEGRVIGEAQSKKINIDTTSDGASMVISGDCDSTYAVILTYRHQDDYVKRRGSYLVNRAQECRNGSFSFDLSSVSPETREGAQYLVVGEQGETGTWRVVSNVIPIQIDATTTVQTIYEQPNH